MSVLVINSGSSSIKYQLVDPDTGEAVATGLVERIGEENGLIRHAYGDRVREIEGPVADHGVGLETAIDLFEEIGPSLTDGAIRAVGHRIVQGGKYFDGPALVDDAVQAKIEELCPLAPLHNPAHLKGIVVARRLLPDVPHVAIFDTAFFAKLPAEAYTYAIDKEVARKYELRRYGFHGTSHSYVSKKTAEVLGRPVEDLKVIVCHLGNGASISAVDGGRAVETSMGLTPLQGLVMGTRSGDIDPSAVTYLMEKLGKQPQEMADFLNKESGVLGITGISSDMRDIENADNEGNKMAHLALQMYTYRIKKYIGAYAAAMNGVDIIVWTAGVGENQTGLRWDACKDMEYLGIKLDKERNECRGVEKILSADDSKVKVVLVPTDEEIVIARDTQELVKNLKK